MRLLIADDSALIRAGLHRLVTYAGHEIIGTAADADALAVLVEGERPDVAILDIRMPPTFTDEGARAALDLRERWPDVGILLLSHLMKRAQTGSIIERLSPREHDMLALVAEGRSNKAISARLRLSGKTVENHVSNVFAKLDLVDDADEHRRIRAVLLYLEHSAPR